MNHGIFTKSAKADLTRDQQLSLTIIGTYRVLSAGLIIIIGFVA